MLHAEMQTRMRTRIVPKTIQIRDLDDDVYRELARRAADDDLTVPEYLRRLLRQHVSRPTMKQWLERVRGQPVRHDISTQETLDALDEIRGPRPDAGR